MFHYRSYGRAVRVTILSSLGRRFNPLGAREQFKISIFHRGCLALLKTSVVNKNLKKKEIMWARTETGESMRRS